MKNLVKSQIGGGIWDERMWHIKLKKKKTLLRASVQTRSSRRISESENKSNEKESQTKKSAKAKKTFKAYRRPESE